MGEVQLPWSSNYQMSNIREKPTLNKSSKAVKFLVSVTILSLNFFAHGLTLKEKKNTL